MEDREHLANDKPEKPLRILRLKEVKMRVGLGRSTIYRWTSEGRFPKPVRLGGNSVGWIESTIDTWIKSRTNDNRCDTTFSDYS